MKKTFSIIVICLLTLFSPVQAVNPVIKSLKFPKITLPKIKLPFGKKTITLTLDEGTYTGQVKRSRPHGVGKMTYDNGDMYEGEWEKGVRQGTGKMIYANGETYEGEFVVQLLFIEIFSFICC